MAAVTELSVLLFALINNIHADQLLFIEKQGTRFTFKPPKEANFCLISRLVGEEKLVLWNTSVLWSENSTLPEDLKKRLSVVRGPESSYSIQNLIHSDSGRYQEECWTEGNVTSERNLTLIICDEERVGTIYHVTLGQTEDLPCDGAADGLDVQWFKNDFSSPEDEWSRVFEDSETSVMDGVKVMRNSSALRLSNFTGRFPLYSCLVMNQQQCVSSDVVSLYLSTLIYHSVGETAVLPCIISDIIDDQPPVWRYFPRDTADLDLGQNKSLVLSPLTLNHSGLYSCRNNVTEFRTQFYQLVVCPKSDPPAVELFSEGDEVTLRCRDWDESKNIYWFMKFNQSEMRVLSSPFSPSDWSSRLKRANSSLIISNVSVEDTGEYWCAVMKGLYQCESASVTVLRSREPFGFDVTLYIVRCSVLSGLLLILWVVVVAVNQRTRRGERDNRGTRDGRE